MGKGRAVLLRIDCTIKGLHSSLPSSLYLKPRKHSFGCVVYFVQWDVSFAVNSPSIRFSGSFEDSSVCAEKRAFLASILWMFVTMLNFKHEL
ncbi:hypothetical protein DdX_04205 [Ditylenchus destructor]|uniref:Uncharacterized protein n=1 Tax=Ditylenchus destructor TaxID=166010 RepID=A0AAD4N7W5_9BILA|nr:hypothetical protein DdX_04205 [Ditylenchus destructor]